MRGLKWCERVLCQRVWWSSDTWIWLVFADCATTIRIHFNRILAIGELARSRLQCDFNEALSVVWSLWWSARENSNSANGSTVTGCVTGKEKKKILFSNTAGVCLSRGKGQTPPPPVPILRPHRIICYYGVERKTQGIGPRVQWGNVLRTWRLCEVSSRVSESYIFFLSCVRKRLLKLMSRIGPDVDDLCLFFFFFWERLMIFQLKIWFNIVRI